MVNIKSNKLVRYIRESYVELQKVDWPNSDTIRKHTLLVIGISLFIGLYFAVSDYVLNLLLEAII